MFMFHFEREVTVFGFLRFVSSYFRCICRHWSFNLARCTTDVEDKHSLFKWRLTTLKKPLPFQTCKKVVTFPFLYFIIPWFIQGIIDIQERKLDKLIKTIKWAAKKLRKPKRNIDVITQSQVLRMHALLSQLYIL